MYPTLLIAAYTGGGGRQVVHGHAPGGGVHGGDGAHRAARRRVGAELGYNPQGPPL